MFRDGITNLAALALLSTLPAMVSGCWGSGAADGRERSRWTHDGTETADAGDAAADPDAGPALALGRPAAEGEGFEPYASTGAEIELVHGFQGGYHVEPTLHVTGLAGGPPDAEATYVVTKRSSGDRVNRHSRYPVGPRSWVAHDSGYLHYSNPVVFDVESPADITGTAVRLEVDVQLVEGPDLTAVANGTIVDEDGR